MGETQNIPKPSSPPKTITVLYEDGRELKLDCLGEETFAFLTPAEAIVNGNFDHVLQLIYACQKYIFSLQADPKGGNN